MKQTLIKTLLVSLTLLLIVPCVTACEPDLIRQENDYRAAMDELHLGKSTAAAAKYLKDLHAEYGSCNITCPRKAEAMSRNLSPRSISSKDDPA